MQQDDTKSKSYEEGNCAELRGKPANGYRDGYKMTPLRQVYERRREAAMLHQAEIEKAKHREANEAFRRAFIEALKDPYVRQLLQEIVTGNDNSMKPK